MKCSAHYGERVREQVLAARGSVNGSPLVQSCNTLYYPPRGIMNYPILTHTQGDS